MRTLVVEDSRSMRRLLEMMLMERGHEVQSFDRVEPGLRAHLDKPFDLFVLDWMLPGTKTGLDLAREVRRLPGGDSTVILVLTGHDGPEQLEAVLDAGANDYMTKPLDPDALRTRIRIAERSVLEHQRRRKAEEALRRSERTFRSLTEAAPTGILVRRNSRVLYANPSFASALGYSPSELAGAPYPALVLEDDRATIREELQSAPPVESSMGHERRFHRKDESVLVAEVVEMPTTFDGKSAVLEVVHDLTERRQIQARAQLADRMASVGTLAAGVAHELNNPLAYVLSNLRLMQEELDLLRPVMSPERLMSLRELADEAAEGAARMGTIVRDLKTFSRADDETRGPVELSPVIESSVNMAWNEVRHRARLHKRFGPTPKVEVNEARIGQVIVNLLLNAAQAIPEGQADRNEVHVVTSTDEDGWAQIHVTDTGAGMAESTVARMYDPFFTTKRGGTGLGLSICHNIVTSAGGEIRVQSELGAGSRFTIRLPPATRIKKSGSATFRQVGSADGHAARVLVVDDEAMVGRSLKRALRDHDVTVVTNGEQAVTMMLAEEFDVILCDLMMPEVTGMDVYERIRSERPGLEHRIVFMTGGAFTPRGREFLDTVGNDQLEKPFDLRVVRNLVRQKSDPSMPLRY